MVGKVVVGLVLVILLGYGLIEAHALLAGPTLSIASPVDGATVAGGILTVSGAEQRSTEITLNGAPLLPDEKGAFSSILTFPHGTSILTFTAADRFGRKITQTRTIYVPE